MSSRSSAAAGPGPGTIFVSGCTGTTGRALMKRLYELAPNVKVKGQYRRDLHLHRVQSIHPKADYVKIDFDTVEPHVLVDHLRGCTSLYIVTSYGVAMLLEVRLLVDAAKEAGVQHIVHLGVLQPVHSPVNFLTWHLMCEKYVEASGLSWTHLRPNMFLENLVNFAGYDVTVNNRCTFPLQPTVSLAWVSANDTAAVAAEALLNRSVHSGKIYPITTTICSVQDVISAIQSAVPHLRDLKLIVPSTEMFCEKVTGAGADPTFMKGIKLLFEGINQVQDMTNLPGSKEGIPVVQTIGGKEPETLEEWAKQEEWKREAATAGPR